MLEVRLTRLECCLNLTGRCHALARECELTEINMAMTKADGGQSLVLSFRSTLSLAFAVVNGGDHHGRGRRP
jgi:hypothetical protein